MSAAMRAMRRERKNTAQRAMLLMLLTYARVERYRVRSAARGDAT